MEHPELCKQFPDARSAALIIIKFIQFEQRHQSFLINVTWSSGCNGWTAIITTELCFISVFAEPSVPEMVVNIVNSFSFSLPAGQ